MDNYNQLLQLLQQLLNSNTNMTGYAGKLPQGALNEAQYQKAFDRENSPMMQQQQAQHFSNAANDRELAMKMGLSAYRNLDQGPMSLQGLVSLLSSFNNQQPFRTQQLPMFNNPWNTRY